MCTGTREDRGVGKTLPRPSREWQRHLDTKGASPLLWSQHPSFHPTMHPSVRPSKQWLWLPAGCLGRSARSRATEGATVITRTGSCGLVS